MLPTFTTYDVSGHRADTIDDALAYAALQVADGRAVTIRRVEDPMRLQFVDSDRDQRDRLRDAFKRLRRTHVTVLGGYCCSSCMWAAVADKREANGKGFVGFNRQSWASWDDDRRNVRADSALYLQHDGADGILDALRAEGLPVEWNGDESKCIAVLPDQSPFCPTAGEPDHRYYCRTCHAVTAVKREAARQRAVYELFPAAVDGDRLTLADIRSLRYHYGSGWARRVRELRAERVAS